MFSPGWAAMAACANSAICCGSPTSTRWTVTSANRLWQSWLRPSAARLVAIGQRQIAAARRQLERQRPADTAGGAGHGGGRSTDRSHLMSAPCREGFVRKNPYTVRQLWQPDAAVARALLPQCRAP